MKQVFFLLAITLFAPALAAKDCTISNLKINELGFASNGGDFVELQCTEACDIKDGSVSISVGDGDCLSTNGLCSKYTFTSDKECGGSNSKFICVGPGCGENWTVQRTQAVEKTGGTVHLVINETLAGGTIATRHQTLTYGELDGKRGSWGLPDDDVTRPYANLQKYFYDNSDDHLSENHVIESTPGTSNHEHVFVRCNAGRGTAVGLLGDPEDLLDKWDAENMPRANCNGEAYDGNCKTRNEIQVAFKDNDAYNIDSSFDGTIYASKKLYLGGEIQLSQFVKKIKLPEVYGKCLAEGHAEDDKPGANNATSSNGSRLHLRLIIEEHIDVSNSNTKEADGSLLDALQIVYDLSDKNDADEDKNHSGPGESLTRKVIAVTTTDANTADDSDGSTFLGVVGGSGCTNKHLGASTSERRIVDLGSFGSEQAINVLSVQRLATADRDFQPYGDITIRLVATEEADDGKSATMVSARKLKLELPQVPLALNKYDVGGDDYKKATDFKDIAVWEDTAGGLKTRVALNTLYYDTTYANPSWKRCVPSNSDHKQGMGWAEVDPAAACSTNADCDVQKGQMCDSGNCLEQVELAEFCAQGDHDWSPSDMEGDRSLSPHGVSGCTGRQYQLFHNGQKFECMEESEKITKGDRYVSVVHFGQCGEGQMATFNPALALATGGLVAGNFDETDNDGKIEKLGDVKCYAPDMLTQFTGVDANALYTSLYIAEPAGEYGKGRSDRTTGRYTKQRMGFWDTRSDNGNCTKETSKEACVANTLDKTIAAGGQEQSMFFQGVEYAAEVNMDELFRTCRGTRKTSSGRGEDTYHFSVAHTLLKPDVRGAQYRSDNPEDYFRSECVQADYLVAINTKLRAQVSAQFGNNIDVMVVSAKLEECDGSNVEMDGETDNVDRFPNGINDGCTDESQCTDGAYRLAVQLQIDNLVIDHDGTGNAGGNNFNYVGIRSANNDIKSQGSMDVEDLYGSGLDAQTGYPNCLTTRDGASAPYGPCKAGPLSPSTYERMQASTSAYGFGDEVRGSNEATSTMRVVQKNSKRYVRQVVTLTTGCFEVIDVNNGNKCEADFFHMNELAIQHADAGTPKETKSSYDLDVRFHACTTEECLAGGKWTLEGGAEESTADLCNQLCHERRGAPGEQDQQSGDREHAFFPLDFDLRHTECPDVSQKANTTNIAADSQLQLYPAVIHPNGEYFEPYGKSADEGGLSDVEFGSGQSVVATIEANDDWVVNSRTVWIRRARLCKVNNGVDATDKGCDSSDVLQQSTYLLVEEGVRYSYEPIYGRDYFKVTACKSMELQGSDGGVVDNGDDWRYGLGFDAQTATTHTHRLCGVNDNGNATDYYGLAPGNEYDGVETLWAVTSNNGDGSVGKSTSGYKCHWDGLRAGNNAATAGYKQFAWDALTFSTDYLVELVDKDANSGDDANARATWLLDIEGEMVDCRSTLDPNESGSNAPQSLRGPRKLRAVTVHTFESSKKPALEASLGFSVKGTRDAAPAPAPVDAPATEATEATEMVAVGYEYATIVLSITTVIGLVYIVGKCVRHGNEGDLGKEGGIMKAVNPIGDQVSLLVPRRMIKPRV